MYALGRESRLSVRSPSPRFHRASAGCRVHDRRESVLVVYYWESLDALESFGADADHKRAKQRWTEWYDAYEVTVTEVLETYGGGFGADADSPR